MSASDVDAAWPLFQRVLADDRSRFESEWNKAGLSSDARRRLDFGSVGFATTLVCVALGKREQGRPTVQQRASLLAGIAESEFRELVDWEFIYAMTTRLCGERHTPRDEHLLGTAETSYVVAALVVGAYTVDGRWFGRRMDSARDRRRLRIGVRFLARIPVSQREDAIRQIAPASPSNERD